MDASAGEIGDKNTFMLQQIFTARHFLEENGKLLRINPAAKSDSLSSTRTYGKLCSSDVHRKKCSKILQTRHFRIKFHQSSRTFARWRFLSALRMRRIVRICFAMQFICVLLRLLLGSVTLCSSPSDDYAIQKVAKGAGEAFLLAGRIAEECPRRGREVLWLNGDELTSRL